MKKQILFLLFTLFSLLFLGYFSLAQTQVNEEVVKLLIQLIQLLQKQQKPIELPKEPLRGGPNEPPLVCAQVITPAKNPLTGECKEFPTPCDVPSDWQRVDSCKVPGPAPLCYTFKRNLKMGDQGEYVLKLREFLAQEGFNIKTNTNVYDEELASAVSGFQEKYRDQILDPLGLKYGTGYFGNLTRKKMNKLYGCRKITDCGPAPLYPTKPGCQRICKDGKWQDICACPPIAPACPLENCLEAAQYLEKIYPGCNYLSACKSCEVSTSTCGKIQCFRF